MVVSELPSPFEFLCGMFFCICFIVGIFNVSISQWKLDSKDNIFSQAFYAQRAIWHRCKRDLNTAGLIIIEFFASAFLLPSNLLLFLAILCVNLASVFWNFFKWVFRRR